MRSVIDAKRHADRFNRAGQLYARVGPELRQLCGLTSRVTGDPGPGEAPPAGVRVTAPLGGMGVSFHHWITRSARTRKLGGRANPSARATLALTTSS